MRYLKIERMARQGDRKKFLGLQVTWRPGSVEWMFGRS